MLLRTPCGLVPVCPYIFVWTACVCVFGLRVCLVCVCVGSVCVFGPACVLSVFLTLFLFPGELKTLRTLDREEQEEHRFKVRALDGGGRYCEADVTITVEDVNDNAPQFASDPYAITVFENTEIGTFVARLLATDIDIGKIIYIHIYHKEF